MFPDLTNFNIGFFVATFEVRFFNLCMTVMLLGVYQFMPGLMTLTLCQGHMCVRIVNIELFVILDSCPL